MGVVDEARLWEMERRLVVGMFDGYTGRPVVEQDLTDKPARTGLQALRQLQADGLRIPGHEGLMRGLAGLGDGTLTILEPFYPVTKGEFEVADAYVASAIVRRRVREAAQRIIRLTEQQVPVEELERDSQSLLGRALQGSRSSDPRPQLLRMERLMDEILAGDTSKGVVDTPWPDLNRILGGIEPGNLVLIGARPSMGKSAFSLQLAQHIARRHGPVLMVSLEMNEREVTRREVAQLIQVNSKLLEATHVSKAIARACPLYLYTDNRGVDDLAALSASFQASHPGMAALFVDYLGLLQSGGPEQHTEAELSYISRSLKRMAERQGIPVVCVHQLNRQVEQRADKRPVLSDLRGSGAIEQDSNLVMFLYRPGYYTGQQDDSEAEVRVAKSRDGATYSVRLSWRAETVSFHSIEIRHEDSDPSPVGRLDYAYGDLEVAL